MASGSTIFVCFSSLLIQIISAQYLTPTGTWSPPCSSTPPASINGGTFTVTSTSPIYPTGITLISDNEIKGQLDVTGNLPLLSVVAIDGTLPTNGNAGTTYSCGNGQVGINTESLSAAGVNVPGYNNAVGANAATSNPYNYGPAPYNNAVSAAANPAVGNSYNYGPAFNNAAPGNIAAANSAGANSFNYGPGAPPAPYGPGPNRKN